MLKPGVASDAFYVDGFFAHCSAHLAPFKVPRFLEFRASLPKTPSEKVAKHVIVGERGFCAGDDIKTSYKRGNTSREELADHLWPHNGEGETPHDFSWSRDVLALERFKPIIGAVNGWCLGQGMIYLLSLTDIRIASTNAKFGFPEVAYGMGGAGGTSRLGLQLPHTVAIWMLLTGEPMEAEEALSHRLVNKVVAPDVLMATAREVAGKIARHPPEAVRVEMEAYYRGRELSRADALAFTKHLYRVQRMGLREEPVQPDRFLYR